MITVRHPFSRLVSAYNDRILSTTYGFYYDLSRKINKRFRHLRHNLAHRNRTDNGKATFEDFVNYLLTINVATCDNHFKSYLTLCRPCDAQYDYVVHFETLANDMEYLKQQLNISDYHRKALFPLKNFKTSTDVVKKAFDQIPKKLGLKLYKKYQKDFEIFGYEKPK